MILILFSIALGYAGILIGGAIGDVYMYLFGAVGIISPALYVLEELYKKELLGKDHRADVPQKPL